MRTPVFFIALGIFLLGAAPAAHAQNANEVCAGCHDVAKTVQASVHSKVDCASCHTKHEEYPHPANVAKPACATCHSQQAADHARSVHGQAVKRGNSAAPDCAVCHGAAHEAKPARSAEFRKKVAETCGMCHTEVMEQFNTSVHGKAAAAGTHDAPVCTSCHGEHAILAPSNEASTVNATHIRETCGSCHANVKLARKFGIPADRVVSFDASFHGLAAKSGSQTVANCASCHGVHNIRPSNDPKSLINAKNLPQTCGRCHPGAGTRFALGPIHRVEGGKTEHAAVKWVRLAYAILIPLTIGFMLMHNGGDFIRKLIARRFRRRPRRTYATAPKEVRMYGFERVQHALMASSFIVLVWTGFALKYPNTWWAWPLVVWESSYPFRGLVHRIAAVIFMIMAAVHVGSLVFSRRLRDHWKEMIPVRRDVGETMLNFAYNIGLTNKKPYRSAHSYIEKMEYWAVIWGGVVMVFTGLVLWFNNWSLTWLPLWMMDVATSVHFYEAVLATLAIVVWHFYGVIFDPDVYPLETAFLTGVSVKEEDGEDGAQAEATELVVDKNE